MKKTYISPVLNLTGKEMQDIVRTSNEGNQVIQLTWDDLTV